MQITKKQIIGAFQSYTGNHILNFNTHELQAVYESCMLVNENLDKIIPQLSKNELKQKLEVVRVYLESAIYKLDNSDHTI
jgi:hypothetical protein